MRSAFLDTAVGGFAIVAWDIEGPELDTQEVDVRWLREQTSSLVCQTLRSNAREAQTEADDCVPRLEAAG